MNFPEILRGAVWHTTTPERLGLILECGVVKPDPGLPESERWGTALGSSHYPFVRSIGGVSLFDFREFDEDQYTQKYPNSSWREFVPCSHRADQAAWIEVDISLIRNGFVDGKALLARWKESGELHRKIMPIIEAAHIGPIPAHVFKRVLNYQKSTNDFIETSGANKHA